MARMARPGDTDLRGYTKSGLAESPSAAFGRGAVTSPAGSISGSAAAMQKPLHTVVPRYQQHFSERFQDSYRDGSPTAGLAARRSVLATAVSPLVAASPSGSQAHGHQGTPLNVASPDSAFSSSLGSHHADPGRSPPAPSLSISLPLDKYEQLLAHVAKKQKEHEVLRGAVMKEREERKKAESTVQSVQSALEEREEELRVYAEEVQRLSFTQETLTKKVAALQRDIEEGKASGAYGARASMLGSLLSSANWERRELEEATAKMEAVSQELTEKIEENESLHIQLFESRQAIERQAGDFEALKKKLERKADDALAFAQAKEGGYASLASRAETLQAKYEATREELIMAQNQATFAKEQLLSLNGSLKATITALSARLALASPLYHHQGSATATHALYAAIDAGCSNSSIDADKADGAASAAGLQGPLGGLLSSLASWRSALEKRRLARLALPLIGGPTSSNRNNEVSKVESEDDADDDGEAAGYDSDDRDGDVRTSVALPVPLSDRRAHHEAVTRLHACDLTLEDKLRALEQAVAAGLGLLRLCTGVLSGTSTEGATATTSPVRQFITKLAAATDALPIAAASSSNSSAVSPLPSWLSRLLEAAFVPLLGTAAFLVVVSCLREVVAAEGERLSAFSALLLLESEASAKAAAMSAAAANDDAEDAADTEQLQALRARRAKELRALYAAAVACSELFAGSKKGSVVELLSRLETNARDALLASGTGDSGSPISLTERRKLQLERTKREKTLAAAINAVQAGASGDVVESEAASISRLLGVAAELGSRGDWEGCEAAALAALLGKEQTPAASNALSLGLAKNFKSLFPVVAAPDSTPKQGVDDEHEQEAEDDDNQQLALANASAELVSPSASPPSAWPSLESAGFASILEGITAVSSALATAQSRSERLREATLALDADEAALALVRAPAPRQAMKTLHSAFASANENAAHTQRVCLAGSFVGETLPALTSFLQAKIAYLARQKTAAHAGSSSNQAPVVFVSIDEAIVSAQQREEAARLQLQQQRLRDQRQQQHHQQALEDGSVDGSIQGTYEEGASIGSTDGGDGTHSEGSTSQWVAQLMAMPAHSQSTHQQREGEGGGHDAAMHHQAFSRSAAARGGNEHGSSSNGDDAGAAGFHSPFSGAMVPGSDSAPSTTTSADMVAADTDTPALPLVSQAQPSDSTPSFVSSVSALSLFPGLFSVAGQPSLAAPLSSHKPLASPALSPAALPPRYSYQVASSAVVGVARAVREKDAAQKKATDLEVLGQALEQQVESLRKAHEQVSASLASVEERHKLALEKVQGGFQERIANLEAQLREAKEDSARWERKCGMRGAEADELRADIARKDKELGKLNTDVDRESRSLLTLGGRLEEEQAANATLRLRLDEEVTANSRLQAQVEGLKEQLASQQGQRLEALDDAEERARELGAELVALKARIDEYERGHDETTGSPTSPSRGHSSALSSRGSFTSPEPQALVLEDAPKARGQASSGDGPDEAGDTSFYEADEEMPQQLKKSEQPAAKKGPRQKAGVKEEDADSDTSLLRKELSIVKESLAEQSQLCFTLKTQLQACQQSLTLQTRLKDEAQAQARRLKDLLTERADGGSRAATAEDSDGSPRAGSSDSGDETNGQGLSVLVRMHKEEVSRLRDELERLQAKHDEELQRIRRQAKERIASIQASHEAELADMQGGHEELVRMVTESHQEQVQGLTETAAVACNDLKRVEGELRELEGHDVRCSKCDVWLPVSEAVLGDGRCTRCHRLMEYFR